MTTNRQASIDSRRVALERQIAIRVPRFDSFVTEYSSNISTTGMFIVSEKPQPPGTSFSFEFSVADDWKLIRGKAQVVWTRYREEGPDRPPGMGVRFLELDAQSRRLIRWIVEKHLREGGKPFELDELRTVVDKALVDVLETGEDLQPETQESPSVSPVEGPARPAPSVRNAAPVSVGQVQERRALPLVLTAAAILAIAGLLFWLTEWPPEERAESGAAASSQPAEAGAELPAPTPDPATPMIESTAATRAAPAPARALGSPPPLGSAYKSVLDSVTAWADAWSSQDINAYLARYSSSFTPGGGLSRRQWEAQRRERLRAPSFIKVSISGLEFDRLDDTRVRVRFTQSYRSNRFNDMVKKTMDLVWENGTWMIAGEGAG